MSRPASGDAKVLMNARQAVVSAQTVEQLRQAHTKHPSNGNVGPEPIILHLTQRCG